MNNPTLYRVMQRFYRLGRKKQRWRHISAGLVTWPLVSSASALTVVLMLAAAAVASDWSSCQSDLDDARRAARDAADAASDVDSKANELNDKRSELQNCLSYPAIYDLMHDGCRSQRDEFASAKDDYDSAKRNLEGELDTLGSRLRSVESSCEYSFSLGSALWRAPSARRYTVPQEGAGTWQPPQESSKASVEPVLRTATPPQLAQPTPAPKADSPLDIVEAYYADLNRHDVEAARGKWLTPPSRLQDMVQLIEWFRIEDIQLVDVDASAAHVTVVVTGKRREQQPERWGGTITLEKRAGVWKIVTMPLTKQ